ncbi:MAG: Ig-like domain-containing protein, partial [Actinomycetota bacterium]|nr:Ig-like domain-containing protein [Actinomycetota bacterium]
MVYRTLDGHVHLQVLDSGAPVGPAAGTSIDEGAADIDVFGTPSTARSVSFADTSGAGGLRQVFAVHNDDDTATNAPDIEVAQLDESDGSVVQQVDVAGTNLSSIRSSVVTTAPDAAGDRALFFVATDGANQRLFRVPISNGSARGATIGTATSTADINTTSNASPSIVYLDVAGTPTAYVAVGTSTQVRTFRANGAVLASVATPDSGSPFGAPGASYSVLVDTTKLADGQYVVDAVATDNGGLSTTSAPHRVTVGNGAAGDDRPPTVQFTAPAAGSLVRDRATVSATAADDRGVKSVAFLDDDRVICTDTTAPYFCSYAPRGDYVGRDTLFAVATDTSDQTGAAIRTVRVDRLLPASVSARTTPARDRGRPFVFTTRGRVNLPAGVTRAKGCRAAVVSVQIKV